MGHRFGDHPAEHLLPAGELADNISGCEDSFAEWIFNHAGPRNPIFNSQRGGVFHVLLAICAVANENKLHIAILSRHQARRLEEIADALLRNYPTYLRDNCSLRRN